jgi:hypothetical protein
MEPAQPRFKCANDVADALMEATCGESCGLAYWNNRGPAVRTARSPS